MRKISKLLFLFSLILVISACSALPNSKNIELTKINLDNHDFVGDINAKNSVIIVQDFECRACANFYQKTYKEIMTNEVPNGTARVYEINLGFTSQTAYLKSMLLIGITKKQPELHQALVEWFYAMDEEKTKKILDKQFLKEELNKKFGAKYDLNDIIDKVFNDEPSYKDVLDKNKAFVSSLGIEHVPTVYVNGIKMNAPESYQEFKSLIIK